MTDLASDSPPRAGTDRAAAFEAKGLVKLYGARCVPVVYDPFLWLGERKVMADLRREVVVTLALCTVADPPAALQEARRVLVARGRLLLIEHVRADKGSALERWQRRLHRL
jgi:hypothetical protein